MSTHGSSRPTGRDSGRLDLSGRSLLAVFAHPDDESLACGGLLAWCADLGARVSLLCATRGELGRGPDEMARRSDPDDLGATRIRELEAAAQLLGIADVMVLGYEDGMLPWADAGLEAAIRQALQRLRPDVVLTFGPDGLYWHPDHMAVHQRATSVVAELGESGPALYYVTMPPGGMRAIVAHAAAVAAARGDDESPQAILGVTAVDAFGSCAEPPTLVVDVGPVAARKLAALRCHRSQLVDSALALVGEPDAGRLLGIEHYRRAAVGSRGDAFVECLAAPGLAGRPDLPS